MAFSRATEDPLLFLGCSIQFAPFSFDLLVCSPKLEAEDEVESPIANFVKIERREEASTDSS